MSITAVARSSLGLAPPGQYLQGIDMVAGIAFPVLKESAPPSILGVCAWPSSGAAVGPVRWLAGALAAGALCESAGLWRRLVVGTAPQRRLRAGRPKRPALESRELGTLADPLTIPPGSHPKVPVLEQEELGLLADPLPAKMGTAKGPWLVYTVGMGLCAGAAQSMRRRAGRHGAAPRAHRVDLAAPASEDAPAEARASDPASPDKAARETSTVWPAESELRAIAKAASSTARPAESPVTTGDESATGSDRVPSGRVSPRPQPPQQLAADLEQAPEVAPEADAAAASPKFYRLFSEGSDTENMDDPAVPDSVSEREVKWVRISTDEETPAAGTADEAEELADDASLGGGGDGGDGGDDDEAQ